MPGPAALKSSPPATPAPPAATLHCFSCCWVKRGEPLILGDPALLMEAADAWRQGHDLKLEHTGISGARAVLHDNCWSPISVDYAAAAQ